ncbi:MAG TPA: zinc ribbon domain-containing protein [Ktedonobacteraceae bacterium]|nr:zinc ribbon domain-containing protein [Ktedonobacteraceae bacterium]
MQCSSCGTQLPDEAAYCPTCGSVTPSQVSSSGVSPSDPTSVYTSYGDSSKNPYAADDPYAAPLTAPPPPPVRRRSPPAAMIALLIALVLLVIAAGGIFFLRTAFSPGQVQTHASPTATVPQATTTPSQEPQATATLSAQSPQSLYDQITQGAPVLDDPLLRNDTNNWAEGASSDGQMSCVFTGGAYHAIAQPKNSYMLCTAQATNFGDLAYQVQMSIVKGEFGGMVFRADGSQSKYYSFFIDRSGNYTLITSVDNTGNNDYVLRQGTSAFIRTGLNQLNTLAVIARGGNIYLYINQQYLTSASDSRYHIGQIGVFGGNVTQAPADVVFSRVQVWNL